MADSASGGENNNALGGPHVVLSHTLPAGRCGVRAHEAAFRQYNSCVDFSFQGLARSNAKKLRRLNVIFERAADRHSGGVRDDKLLRLLPSGTAAKFGLDPTAVRRRFRRQRERAAAAAEESSNGGKRKKNKRLDNDGDAEADLRTLSRGTFLAMFANETSTFINTMGQNEKADRERRAALRGKSGKSSRGGTGNKSSKKRQSKRRDARGGQSGGSSGKTATPPPPGPRSSSPQSASGDPVSSGKGDRSGKSRRTPTKRGGGRSHGRNGRRSQRRRGSTTRDDRANGGAPLGRTTGESSRSRSRSRSRSKSRERLYAQLQQQQHRRAASEGGNAEDAAAPTGAKATRQHRRHSFDILPDMTEILGDGASSSSRAPQPHESSDKENAKPRTASLGGGPTENAAQFDGGHSADEAGGGSSSFSVKSERTRPLSAKELTTGTAAGAEETPSRDERKSLRRERRRLMKEEARRLEAEERERVKSEEKTRILEAEAAGEQRMAAEQKRAEESSGEKNECAFFSSVAKLLKKLFPGPASKKGALIGVAAASGHDLCTDARRVTSYPPRGAHHAHHPSYPLHQRLHARVVGPQFPPPAPPFQHYPGVATSPWHFPGNGHGPPGGAGNVPPAAMRSFSYSSNEGLLGEHMLSTTPPFPLMGAQRAAVPRHQGVLQQR